MKQAKKIILIAAAAIAVLTVSATPHMEGNQQMPHYPGFKATVSTTPHMDGTQPMPPYPG